MMLRQVAHSRTGDKGNLVTISVIAYRQADYAMIRATLTTELVSDRFREFIERPVMRYEIPHLSALIFVLHRPPSQGVTRSLALDAHGKCLGSALLSIDLLSKVNEEFLLEGSNR